MNYKNHTDQMGRIVRIAEHPERIISLVPSQTELLCYLGLEGKISGRTKFCIHPKETVRKINVIGGTKNPRIKEIEGLNPDLIIGNLEENTKEIVDSLEKSFPVWMSDIRTVDAALDMILEIGNLTQTSLKASDLVRSINLERDKLISTASNISQRSCLYLIWKNPYMGAATDTYLDDILKLAGFKNVLSEKQRYPELKLDEIIELSPEIIFLSSEPYPFKQKDVEELEDQLPGIKIRLVDGEMFSWYGNRMLKAFPYLNDLIVHL